MSGTLLVAVVADALEEDAMRIAREEGARGVTSVEARGIGFPEHKIFFGATYQGLERVLIWLLDDPTAIRIAERLNTELDLLKPFQGIAFTLPVEHAGGFDVSAVARLLGQAR